MDDERIEQIKKAWEFEEHQDVFDLLAEVERLKEENQELKDYLKYVMGDLKRHIKGIEYFLDN